MGKVGFVGRCEWACRGSGLRCAWGEPVVVVAWCEPDARLRYPTGHQARRGTSARVLVDGRELIRPTRAPLVGVRRRTLERRRRGVSAPNPLLEGDWRRLALWRGAGRPRKAVRCKRPAPRRNSTERRGGRACRTAEYPTVVHSFHRSLCTPAAGPLRRGASPLLPGSACDNEAEVGARSASGHRSRERCRPLYLVGRRSGSVGSAIVGRLTRAHADLYTSPPLRAPSAGRRLRVSFTSRLLELLPRR